MRIGVISDTHGLLRPEAAARLAGVAHILHAGDIGRPGLVEALSGIAPVTAIRGNVDTGAWADAYPETRTVVLGGRRLYLLHDRNALRTDPAAEGVDVVISGHSHRPLIETVAGALYLNPGSAGPRRFSLPATVATLEIADDGLRAALHDLAAGSA